MMIDAHRWQYFHGSVLPEMPASVFPMLDRIQVAILPVVATMAVSGMARKEWANRASGFARGCAGRSSAKRS